MLNKLSYFLANLSHFRAIKLPTELLSAERRRDGGATVRGLRPAPVRQEDRRRTSRHQRQDGGQSKGWRRSWPFVDIQVLLYHFANSDYTGMMNESQIDI